MNPSNPPAHGHKKRTAPGADIGADILDSANETRLHNRVGGPSQGQDSCPRDTATAKKGEESLDANNCPRMAEKLLLDIQYECARNNINLPWDRIAQRLKFGPSSAAIHEFLQRIRQQLISEGHIVPPLVGLGGRHAADNDADVQGVARSSEDRADYPPTRAVGRNDFRGRMHNLPDAAKVPGVETPKGKKATRTECSDSSSSPEVDDCAKVALPSCRCAVDKSPHADPESAGGRDVIEADEDDPFSDFHEYKEDAAEDDGDISIDDLEELLCDQVQRGDVDNYVADNLADTTALVRARRIPRAQQVNSRTYGSSFGQTEPQAASMHGSMLVSYDGGLSFSCAPSRRITRWSCDSMYTGDTAAADLGHGGTAQSLPSQALDHTSPGPVYPFQALRIEDSPTGVEEGTPTPTNKNHSKAAAQETPAALPTTPTPKCKQLWSTCRKILSSHKEPDDDPDSTPRATVRSLSLGASSTTNTSSTESRRASGSNTVASAAKRDVSKRLKDDGPPNSFADMGFRGSF